MKGDQSPSHRSSPPSRFQRVLRYRVALERPRAVQVQFQPSLSTPGRLILPRGRIRTRENAAAAVSGKGRSLPEVTAGRGKEGTASRRARKERPGERSHSGGSIDHWRSFPRTRLPELGPSLTHVTCPFSSARTHRIGLNRRRSKRSGPGPPIPVGQCTLIVRALCLALRPRRSQSNVPAEAPMRPVYHTAIDEGKIELNSTSTTTARIPCQTRPDWNR